MPQPGIDINAFTWDPGMSKPVIKLSDMRGNSISDLLVEGDNVLQILLGQNQPDLIILVGSLIASFARLSEGS